MANGSDLLNLLAIREREGGREGKGERERKGEKGGREGGGEGERSEGRINFKVILSITYR